MAKNVKTGESIEQLQKRYEGLNKQKIKVETQREHAHQQLKELKAQAKELYGSDDLTQLKTMLADMKKKNEEMRQQYQSKLNDIDSDLAAITEKFNEEQEEE